MPDPPRSVSDRKVRRLRSTLVVVVVLLLLGGLAFVFASPQPPLAERGWPTFQRRHGSVRPSVRPRQTYKPCSAQPGSNASDEPEPRSSSPWWRAAGIRFCPDQFDGKGVGGRAYTD